MSMYYKFQIQENGMIDADIAGDELSIHFDKPESTGYGDKVPILGDTYSVKDQIKSEDWDTTHHEWTGDYWRVDLDTVRVVINNVCRVVKAVSVDPEVVYESDSMTEFEGKIELDDGKDETFEFVLGPGGGDKRCSRSWAESAAERGNYEDVEEFAEKFNLEVVDDKVLYGEIEGPEEVDGIPGSSNAGVED
jgi:hypothetical protein